MFNTILTETLTPMTFGICLGTAFILGLIVSLIHGRTSRANKDFLTTLAVLPTLVAMAILLVNGNLGTGVATVGVFSLVRFRSIPGNARSIMSVFFAMAIGLAVGTGYIAFATIFTIVIGLIILVLDKLNFGAGNMMEKKLTILVPEDMDYTTMFDEIFAKYTTAHELEMSKTTNMGSLFELVYNVRLKNDINEKNLIDDIRVKNGNLKVMLSQTIAEEEL